MLNNEKSVCEKIKDMCNQYGFQTEFTGLNDNYYCEV